MKKAFAILLAICMMIPVFAVSTFAVDNSEATEIDNTIPTVYVASAGYTRNAEKALGTSENPYTYFLDAYNSFVTSQTGGKIVMLDDVKFAETITTRDHVLGAIEGDPTVYVCGTYLEDEDEGRYSCLDFSYTSGTGGFVLVLGTDMVFYDMMVKHTTSGNVFFAAQYHSLTFGFNFNDSKDKDGKVIDLVTGGSVAILGTNFASNTLNSDDYTTSESKKYAKRGVNITVYSGNFGDFIIGNRQNNPGIYTTQASTVNVYGGAWGSMYILNYSSGGSIDGTLWQSDVTINIYGGKGKIGGTKEQATNGKLNIYNGTESNLTAVKESSPFVDATTGAWTDKVNIKTEPAKLTAPSYAVNFSGVQDKSESEKFSVRLVGTVDSLEFDYVGFEIDINGMDYSNTSKRVYTSIQGADATYTAAQLGSNYIYTRTITGIPKTGTITFTIRPFIRIGDVASGVNYYGQEYTVIYVNGVLQK